MKEVKRLCDSIVMMKEGQIVGQGTCEELIKKLSLKYKFKYGILRYFNVAGASNSGKIGEIETSHGHLIKNLAIKSLEKKPKVKIFGNDYETIDGTGLRDYIHIKSSGRLIKEFKSVNQGLVVTKKNIPRDELEAFAEFIINQNFFETEITYDCDDVICQKRKTKKPTPIPLRVVVAYGTRKKVVTISIWGKDKNNIKYVNYPDSIDNIIDAIQKMAVREEES